MDGHYLSADTLANAALPLIFTIDAVNLRFFQAAPANADAIPLLATDYCAGCR
jgi:hypothetical protein